VSAHEPDTVAGTSALLAASAPIRPQRKRVECLGITLALAIAAVNPGTGYLSGFFAAVVVSCLVWVRNARSWTSGTTDVVVAIAIGLTLLSPYWHAETSAQTSPSHGAAVSMIFFVAVRIVVTSAAIFRELAAQVALLCTAYAAYFLAFATAYDRINYRAAVSFSTANYTGAILAFGGAAAIFLAAQQTGPGRAVRAGWVGAFVLQALAIYVSGSRASFAGLALAAVSVALWRFAPRLIPVATRCLVVLGFFFALIPDSINLFTKPAYLLAGAGTFARGEAAGNASGRAEIWAQANAVLDEAWITGWGPGNYYLTVGDDPTFLAHAWGLEYLLSVGVLGTLFVGATLLLAYCAATRPPGSIWTAATALSLLPSLMLSTHQWTLWAWLGFALWSRADLLMVDRRDPPGREGTPSTAHPEP
jgi:O-antigen ligase